MVSEKKTEVGLVFGRKFLGYCLRRWTKGKVKIAVAPKVLNTFKQRIRLIHVGLVAEAWVRSQSK